MIGGSASACFNSTNDEYRHSLGPDRTSPVPVERGPSQTEPQLTELYMASAHTRNSPRIVFCLIESDASNTLSIYIGHSTK